MQQNNEAKKKKRNKLATPLASAVVLFAVIGLVTVISASVRWTISLLDRSGDIEAFESFIMPVIMFDPIPFESIDKANEDLIRQASIWSCLISEKRNTYGYDDSGMLMLPVSDVDVAAAALFGSEVVITHETFGDYETTYIYDEISKLYKVPIMAQTAFYRPDVVEIDEVGDTVSLTVGYIPPVDSWSMGLIEPDSQPAPDKYMIYHLTQTQNGHKISAIEAVTSEEYTVVPEASQSSQGQ